MESIVVVTSPAATQDLATLDVAREELKIADHAQDEALLRRILKRQAQGENARRVLAALDDARHMRQIGISRHSRAPP